MCKYYVEERSGAVDSDPMGCYLYKGLICETADGEIWYHNKDQEIEYLATPETWSWLVALTSSRETSRSEWAKGCLNLGWMELGKLLSFPSHSVRYRFHSSSSYVQWRNAMAVFHELGLISLGQRV